MRASQIVTALPELLAPLTVYYVRRSNGSGYDVTITDAVGVPEPVNLNLVKGEPGDAETVTATSIAKTAAQAAAVQATASSQAAQASALTAGARAAETIAAVSEARATMDTARAAAEQAANAIGSSAASAQAAAASAQAASGHATTAAQSSATATAAAATATASAQTATTKAAEASATLAGRLSEGDAISRLADGGGFVRMTSAERAKLTALVDNFKGYHASLAAVAAAHPAPGNGWAIISKPGAPATVAVWDSDASPAAWVDTDAAAGVDQAGTYTWSGRHTWSMAAIVTSQPYAMSQTWNAAAVAFEARSVSVTDTASAAASLLDALRVGGVDQWTVDKSGSAWARSAISVGSTGELRIQSRLRMAAPADGIMLLRNAANVDFGRVQFGGTTNGFPAIKRSGVVLQGRLADDSGWADTQWGRYLQADGTPVGRMTAIRSYTASTTWAKPASLDYIIVEVWGAGAEAAGGSSGGTSSFGAHCSATGGTQNGAPGAGTGGDINLTGGEGGNSSLANSGYTQVFGDGGAAPLGGPGGRGAGPVQGQRPGGGAGSGTTSTKAGPAGGYSRKRIAAAALGATETVTVGAAGATAGGGMIIVHEFTG